MTLLETVRKNDGLKLLLIVMAVLVFGTGIVVISRSYAPAPEPLPEIQVAQPQSTAQSTIVYGVWEGTETVIHAVNADGTGDQIIARIPLAVKNIHRLDADRFISIANTNPRDHGDSIEIRDVTAGTSQRVVAATPGWGIDSLIVSGDGRWIAYWEVQLGPNGRLMDGNSRVYTASLTTIPAQRHLVFDESAQGKAVVHYPLFFDHAGNLYADGFSPNGDGWGQGLVRTGVMPAAPNQFIEVLANESYNSNPMLSPTGNWIAYTAYDPAAGQPITAADGKSGKTTVESLNPTVIRLLDLDTGTTRALTTGSGRLYYDVTWKDDGSAVFARSYGSNGTQLTDPQAVTIDINSGVATQWDTTKLVDGIILEFGPDGLITGVGHASGAVGNLGKTYAPVLAGIAVGDGNNLTTIPTANAQFITTIAGTVPLGSVNSGYRPGSTSLQLATFKMKPEIHQRPAQQNELILPTLNITERMKCRDIYNQLIGQPPVEVSSSTSMFPPLDPSNPDLQTTTGRDPSLQLGQFGPAAQSGSVNIPFNLPSFSQAKPMLRELYNCYDSPLYLYPEEPTKVNVTVTNADILSTDMPYTAEDGWNLMADPKGTKIEYAYGAPFTAPANGLIVAASHLESELNDYGTRVGLNDRELSDYVSFWMQEVPQADYYLVSHFSNPSSIMNFIITPQPDVMIQTIMYFKPLTASQAATYTNLSAAQFPSIPARTGFTAVDWSGIIDR